MTKSFTVDARTVLNLGRDSIKDHTTALVELVKNSYDADATRVEVEIMLYGEQPYIRIADNGSGMTNDDIDNRWLRIGFSEKIKEKVSKLKRRRTGEKGIGRISADRLGSVLVLYTQAKGENPVGLKICWDKFEVAGQDISSIPIDEIEKPNIQIPNDMDINDGDSGTEMIISNLRQEWTRDDVIELGRELSILVSPFSQTDNFQVKISSDILGIETALVRSEIGERFQIRLDAGYNPETDIITYVFTENATSTLEETRVSSESIDWNSLPLKRRKSDTEPNFARRNLGVISTTILFYPLIPDVLEGSGFNLNDLREYLNRNAGISIYRDNIRVKPYGNLGEPQGDWLGLGRRYSRNPAGVGRKSYKSGPNQFVGAVFVTRDGNPELVDSSSREGLINNEAFLHLKDFMLGCVALVEAHRHELHMAKEEQKQSGPTQNVKELGQAVALFNKELKAISNILSRQDRRSVERILDRANMLENLIRDSQKSLREIVLQNTMYRALATVGIAATVFGHETQISISSLTTEAYNAGIYLSKNPPDIDGAKDSVAKAKKYSDQVAQWGKFALDRIRRDKRSKKRLLLDQLVLGIVEELRPTMRAVDIDIKCLIVDRVEVETYAMDVEAILLNLLTNAYAACKKKKKNRIIRIELRASNRNEILGYEIVVADSGPGVDKKFLNLIWNPLFTTRKEETNKKEDKDGTGLGLTIIQSIVDELKGSRSVDRDPELTGARFCIWLPEK